MKSRTRQGPHSLVEPGESIRGTTDAKPSVVCTDFLHLGDWVFFRLAPTQTSRFLQATQVKATLFEAPDLLIADGGSSWWVREGGLMASWPARVLHGQHLLEASGSDDVPVLVLVGEERSVVGPHESEVKIGTSTERLKIDTRWSQGTVRGEPFVMPTIRGYVASLLVENANGNLEHLIISPKSLTTFFEGIRSRRGNLDGLKIRVRKVSADRTAAYEVEELK